MKTKKNIWLKQLLCIIQTGMLTLGTWMILCMPQLATNSEAQSYTSNSGWYFGMAYLAENEIRQRERNATVNNEGTKIATNVAANASDNAESDLRHTKNVCPENK